MPKSAQALRIISGLMAGIVIATAIAVAAQSGAGVHATETQTKGTGTMTTQTFVGMWVTADGHIRHELLPNGRYDEARGSKRSAYQGRYVITGNHIDYIDDTGFTADGDFIDGVLHHAGMILRRENQPSTSQEPRMLGVGNFPSAQRWQPVWSTLRERKSPVRELPVSDIIPNVQGRAPG